MLHAPRAEKPCELAYRTNGGAEFVLLWSRLDNCSTIRISDPQAGDVLRLDFASDNALDVFYHSCAHAAVRERASGRPAPVGGGGLVRELRRGS